MERVSIIETPLKNFERCFILILQKPRRNGGVFERSNFAFDYETANQ